MSQSSHDPIQGIDAPVSGSGASSVTDPGTAAPDEAVPATVLLFDPLTDTSPYAQARRPKKIKTPDEKPSARRSPKRARSAVSDAEPSAATPSPQLRIVSDDPGEIAQYAEAQQRSDADRTAAGQQLQTITVSQSEEGASPYQDASPYDEAVSPYEKTYREQPSSLQHRFVREYLAGSSEETVQSVSYQQSDQVSPYDRTVRPKKSARGPRVSRPTQADLTFATKQSTSDASDALSEITDRDQDAKPSARRHMPKASGAVFVGLSVRMRRRTSDPNAEDDEVETTGRRRRAPRRPKNPERRWNRALIAVTTLTTIAVALVMLYFPAQDMYASIRENERLADELDKNVERNSQMQERVTSLQTAEGIQDEARSVYGMVEAGETAVSVIGIDDDSSSTSILTEVPRGSGENTNTWFTDLLDRIFGITDANIAEATDVATLTEQIVEDADELSDDDVLDEIDTFEVDATADIIAQGDEQAE